MPLRDDRRGRRATIFTGTTPLRPEFHENFSTGPASREAEGPREESIEQSVANEPYDALPDVAHATSEKRTNAQAIVLDPFAFLTVLAQPLFAARDACVRFVSGAPAAPATKAPDGNAVADALTQIEREASVIERSFASEFATLIGRPSGRPSSEDAPHVASSDAPSPELHDPSASQTVVPLPDDFPHRIVSRSTTPLVERSVPITRLPLRPKENEITWTQDVGGIEFDDTASRTQRHGLLERSVRDAGLSDTVLKRAYREEDLEGRTIALRALSRLYPAQGTEIFVEALRIGSDDERALAIDGLTSAGARAELVPAFGDRVDAVAAKAALAYVGLRSRAEYRAELASYVDAAQIDKILTLLAGIIE